MLRRGYQYNFSNKGDVMYDVFGRERKARTMLAVLQDYFRTSLNQLRLLDVGGSSGIIDNVLAQYFGSVVSIDIDVSAIAHAKHSYSRPNLSFAVGDAMAMDFSDETCDVVVCSQVYEHVPDAAIMMREIRRVLRPGGVCYFAASNRLMWTEPHYRLPLLSVLPRPLAHFYVRLAGRASHYHEFHYTYWGLRALVKGFDLVDYTARIVNAPEIFGVTYMLKPGTLKALLAKSVVRYLPWLMPGYIWVLKKPGKFVAQPALPADGAAPRR